MQDILGSMGEQNPFIPARIVKKLRLYEDANGEQVLDWAEVTLEV
ncbi:hypothetical protein [Hyphomonas sp. UBA1923]|nr:hypothetical protein [Hyphomonas sp. UBA1923]